VFLGLSRDSLHALLEHRVPPGLADDDVGPLNHHDADEERRVAGELHDLPLLVGLERGRRGHRESSGTPGGLEALVFPVPRTHCCP